MRGAESRAQGTKMHEVARLADALVEVAALQTT